MSRPLQAWNEVKINHFHILKGQMEALGKIHCSLVIKSLCAVSRVNSLPDEEEKEADVTQKSPGTAVFITPCCFLPVPREKVRGKCDVRSSESFKPLPVSERLLMLDVSLFLHCFVPL